MAKDDYFVIVYQILAYLYQKMQIFTMRGVYFWPMIAYNIGARAIAFA